MIYDFFNPYGGLNTMSDNYVTGDNIYERELQNFFFQTLGMMSITHYGAIGDGRRDNYGPLQVAIDDAVRRKLNYIYVPRGTYVYTGELLHRNGITFVGNPHAKIVNIRTGEKIPIEIFGPSPVFGASLYDIKKLSQALGEYVDYTEELELGRYLAPDDEDRLTEVLEENSAYILCDARILYSVVKIKGMCVNSQMYYVTDDTYKVIYRSPEGMAFSDLTDIIAFMPMDARYICFNFRDTDKISPELHLLDIVGGSDTYTKQEIDAMLAFKQDVSDMVDYYTKAEVDAELANKQNTLVAGEGITIDNDVISVTASIEGDPFSSCPFPTSWSGTDVDLTGTNAYGTWEITTTADPASGTSLSYAFDDNNSTRFTPQTGTSHFGYVEIDLPSGVSIRPVDVFVRWAVSTLSENPRQFLGYSEETSSWRVLYEFGNSSISAIRNFTLNIDTAEYFTKFKLTEVGKLMEIDGLYEIQINSGYIKNENVVPDNPIE